MDRTDRLSKKKLNLPSRFMKVEYLISYKQFSKLVTKKQDKTIKQRKKVYLKILKEIDKKVKFNKKLNEKK